MRVLLGVLLVAGAIWLTWRALALRPRLPRGLTDLARFRSELGLRELAEALHQAIRSRVLTQVERQEEVLMVSCGIATPPGPVRLILEERSGGLPGMRYAAMVRRRAGTRDGLELELRGSAKWSLLPLRGGGAKLVVEAVAVGLSSVEGVSDIEWLEQRKLR